MSLLRITELEAQIKRRDERIKQLEQLSNSLLNKLQEITAILSK